MNRQVMKQTALGLFMCFIFGCVGVALATKTNFTTGTTVTSDFMNSIYYTGGGHVHDDGTEDGSVSRILCDINATSTQMHWVAGCIPETAIDTVACTDLNLTSDCIDGSYVDMNCGELKNWGAAGCASDVCDVTFSSASCDGIFTCDNMDYTNADCKNDIPYNAQAFASTQYDFVPIETAKEVGGTGFNEVYTNVIESDSGGELNYYWAIAWRPPTASTIDDEYIRFLYVCDETDTDHFDLTMELDDPPVGSGFTMQSIYTSTNLPCTTNLTGTTWAAFVGTGADSDDGIVYIRGKVHTDTDADQTYMTIIGVEIKYTGTKE